MNRIALGVLVGSVALVSAAWSAGCGTTDVQFNAGGAGGAKATASAGGHAGGHAGGASVGGAGGVTSTSATTSSTATTGTTTSSSTSTSTTSTTASASSSSGGGCTADSADDACVACAKQDCCGTLVACQSDASCVCWTGCLAQNPNNAGACVACGAYDATTNAFVTCAEQGCAAACGGGNAASSSSGPGASSSSSSGGGACAPVAGDSACTSCSKMHCCDDVKACAADQNCICWVACLGQGGSLQTCPQVCGAADAATTSLFQCSLQQCQGSCS